MRLSFCPTLVSFPVRQAMSRVVFTALCVVFLLGSVGRTQTITATILGTVEDTTGAVIPGVTVEVRNTDTGVTRTVETDARGAYVAPLLPLGNYQVQASSTGFKVQIRTGITLTIGQAATIDLILEVGDVTESVTVTGEAPLVETSGMSTLGGLVTSQAVEDLPLNGRSFSQLAELTPGVVPNTQSGGEFLIGRATKLSVGGARGSMNTFLLDGTAIDNSYNSGPGGAKGFLLGVDTIREFKVLVNNYSAEYGKNAGGVINVVTLGGTNTFHGSIYEYLRNDKLDAKNFFDDATQPIPPFRRNQFGVAVGGPIRQDKLFFHVNYEGFRERLGISHASPVLTARAQQGFLEDEACPDGCGPGAAAGERFVGVDPKMRPYLDILPLPNSPRKLGPNVGEWLGGSSQPGTEDFISARLDYNISDNDAIFGRYTFSDSELLPPYLLPTFGADEGIRLHYLTLQHTHIFSPTLLNTARFGFARNARNMNSIQLEPLDPSLDFNDKFPFGVGGGLNIPALAAGIRGSPLENGVLNPIDSVLNNFEYANTIDWTIGRHTIKTGFKLSRLRNNNSIKVFPSWLYFFSNIENVLTANPLGFFGESLVSDTDRSLRHTMYGAFFQDDIRVLPNLSLSLGVRYENMRAPMETNGKLAHWYDLTEMEPTIAPNNGKGPYYEDFCTYCFAPRAGFSWDPTNSGRTSIRGGFGLFFDQLGPAHYTTGLPPKAGRKFVLFLAGLGVPGFPKADFPNETVPGISGPYQIESDLYNHMPYMMHFNLNIQRQLSNSMSFSIGYAGSNGVHLVIPVDAGSRPADRLEDGRWFNPADAMGNPLYPRLSPNIGESSIKETGAHSTYHGLILSFERRFSQGLAAQINYTFSKNIDDSSEEYTVTSRSSRKNVHNRHDFRSSRSTGTFSRKSIFNTNVAYDLPFGRDLDGAAGKLLGGWQISSIINAYSGFPVNVTMEFDTARSGTAPGVNTGHRPNLRPGFSNNPTSGVTAGCSGIPAGQKLQEPGRWFDPCAFEQQEPGFYGNTGRNTVVGPGLFTFDFAVSKSTPLTEQVRLEFESQFFNMFNRPNFDVPQTSVLGDATNNRLPNAGVIGGTATTSRQIQFALKVVF